MQLIDDLLLFLGIGNEVLKPEQFLETLIQGALSFIKYAKLGTRTVVFYRFKDHISLALVEISEEIYHATQLFYFDLFSLIYFDDKWNSNIFISIFSFSLFLYDYINAFLVCFLFSQLQSYSYGKLVALLILN